MFGSFLIVLLLLRAYIIKRDSNKAFSKLIKVNRAVKNGTRVNATSVCLNQLSNDQNYEKMDNTKANFNLTINLNI